MLYREWFVRLPLPRSRTRQDHRRHSRGVGAAGACRSCRGRELSMSRRVRITRSEGPKFLRITDIVGGPVNWGSVPRCRILKEKMNGFLVAADDIVVARTGATTGWARRIGRHAEPVVFASYLVRFRFGKNYSPEIAATYMQSDSYKAFVKRNLGGAAQPNASAKVLGRAIVPVPPAPLQSYFSASIRPTFDQIDILMEQNHKLAQTRDLLLPRLMNGEVAV